MSIQYTGRTIPRLDLSEAYNEWNPDGQFVGTQVFAPRTTRVKSGNFPRIIRENYTTVDEARHANGAPYNRINIYAEDDTYSCDEFGLEVKVTREDRANYANDFDAEVASVGIVAEKLRLKLESDIADATFNTTTWTGSSLYTDVSGAPWATASSDVIGPINDAKEKVRQNTGTKADTLVISEKTLSDLLTNTGIVARFPGASMVTEQMIRNQLASIFGLTKLVVGGAVKNTKEEGLTGVYSDVWSSTYAMVCKTVSDDAAISLPCIGRTMVWNGVNEGIAAVEQYPEEQTKSDVFNVSHYVDIKVMDPSLGHLLEIN